MNTARLLLKGEQYVQSKIQMKRSQTEGRSSKFE
jgi:hypothetical protein